MGHTEWSASFNFQGEELTFTYSIPHLELKYMEGGDYDDVPLRRFRTSFDDDKEYFAGEPSRKKARVGGFGDTVVAFAAK